MPPESQAGLDQRQARLTRLIGQYQPALHRLVNFYEADRSRGEDLFQEVLLGLWQAIPQFRGASSERTWFYRIAHNIAISAVYSRRRRERSELPMTGTVEYPSEAENPDSALILREKRDTMLAAIRDLPAIDRQVVVLHLEGLSHEEIEQVSGLSQNAIATRLSRIRARLSEAVRRIEAHI
jgi:RNA polymerase sigma-70 factor (ECF subfamily)